MSRDPLDYKEGRGDYYLAEGKRAMSTDERSSEQQPKVRPSTTAGQELLHDLNFDPHQRQRLKGGILAIEVEAGAERDRLEAALRHALKFANRIYEQREWSESDLLEIIHTADDALSARP